MSMSLSHISKMSINIHMKTDFFEGMIQERNYSAPLIHSTNSTAIYGILREGFKFTNALDEEHQNTESEYIPRHGYNYFLSTSRSKLSQFRSEDMGRINRIALILNMDEVRNRFLVRPVKYWPGKKSVWDESEERLWSRKQMHPAIPLISEIHIFDMAEDIIDLTIKPKAPNIPIYNYRDRKDFGLLLKQRAQLFERTYTGVVYHSTFMEAAIAILNENRFFLGVASTNSERRGQPSPKHHYFLSTARSKMDTFKSYLDTIVTFTLNVDYFKKLRHVRIRPFHYHNEPMNDNWKLGESEERIWSTKEKLPARPAIMEIHVNLSYHGYKAAMPALEQAAGNIPIYTYENPADYYRMSKSTGWP